MTLEQVEANQATMRSDINTIQEKMDQLLETMLAIAQRERVADAEDEARRNDNPSSLVHPDEGYVHAKKSLVHIPIGSKGEGDRAEPSEAPAHYGSEIGDDPYEAFYVPDHPKPKTLPDPSADRLRALEKKVKAIEGNNIFGASNMNMRLVSNLVIPAKFKTPDFEKYQGQTCPRSHLVMYFRKMAAHTENDKLLIHCFQDSLSGASLRWYMSLEQGRIQSWEDLADAFLRQYKYNLDMAPDRMQLQGMAMKENELVSSAASDFAHLVTIGDRIEKGLRDGKISGAVATSSAPKKYSGGFQKKKEGETNAVSRGYKGKQQASYGQVAAVVPIPYQQPIQQQPMYQPQHQQPRRQQNTAPPRQFKPKPPRRQLDPLPVPYSQIFPYLQKEGLLTLRELKPAVLPYPPGYDANAHCEFHMGAPGHTLENCFAFQNRVQDLIEAKVVTFTPRRPNVNTNPMPTHGGASVSAIEESDQGELILKVEEIQTPITMIGAQLLKSGLVSEELVNDENDKGLRNFIQQMLDRGELQISRRAKNKEEKEIAVVVDILYDEVNVDIPFDKVNVDIPFDKVNVDIPFDEVNVDIPFDEVNVAIPYDEVNVEIPINPLVIEFPAPFAYEDEKAVPWIYQPRAFKQGQEDQPVVINEPNVTSIVGPAGITRSGRVFAPRAVDASTKAKGKEIATPVQIPVPSREMQDMHLSPKAAVTREEAEEFLRIIKKSDYKVVDQLNQTPSKISMLSLLLNSEAHRNSLLKVLSATHITKDITTEQFDDVIACVTTGNFLGFNDDELPVEGKNHNKALHISLKCIDTILSRVLVDTGSSLNVMPKTTLIKLPMEGMNMKPSTLIVKAFDGSRRAVIGEVDLPIKIGPTFFNITFQVMDIHPGYSCLLGRPWIHSAGAVTSTLHQKLKFITDDKMIVIGGEEDILVSHLTSFRYIEVDGEITETPFQSLEVVNMMAVQKTLETPKSGPSMASWQGAKAVIESENTQDWGKVVEVNQKRDKFGLGYDPSSIEASNHHDGEQIPPVKETFISAGHIFGNQVAMINVEDHEEGASSWIRQVAPNEELTNWKAVEVPQIFQK
ncbi:uncharacterized protein LOC127130033 [Lathyrus oleraceus]|uniref:uncharacterized protein LOC127130033 n=1 Tax=Pisum sativum TaxID=3888 RepID=UPI0021CF8E33|nr:uncharacterized protein LOC127130033 [Pisum sativum]